ncbi:hypothetical protein Zmor_006717 [Zophobas morio]|uniref:HAUS augmin-like complex subunit 4 n=1 Tax=Zophobas morio TaxID=2755281 RepID=A0AA38MNT2_9CUCU|nr:hypothetical protein Zmor_006717 [Zophobas morio]
MSDRIQNLLLATAASNCTSAQRQELNDLKHFYEKEYGKYNKYKILFEAIRETAFDYDSLEPELKTKVQNILLETNCIQVIDLDGIGDNLNSNSALGLTNFNSALHYSESLKLKEVVKLRLQDLYKNICETFRKITGENIDKIKYDDQAPIDLKNELELQQKKYICNLLEEQRILQDMVNLRLQKVPQICMNKVLEFQVKSQMSSLQSKIVEEKARIDIFTETSNSLSAYEELMKDIRMQRQECLADIQNLQDLKEKYKQVSCGKYDEILKSFIQYKSSLAKKKMIYESLQC